MSKRAENATHTDVMPGNIVASMQSPARPPTLAEQFEELLDGFRASENQRFMWVEQCKGDFRDWITRRGVLDRQAEAMLQNLKDAGFDEQATQLSAALAAQRLVSHPGSFDIVYTTDYGVEKMVVFFEGRETTRGGSESNGTTNTPCSGTDASDSEMGSAAEEEESDPVDLLTAAENRPVVLPQQPTPLGPLPTPAKQLPACKRVWVSPCWPSKDDIDFISSANKNTTRVTVRSHPAPVAWKAKQNASTRMPGSFRPASDANKNTTRVTARSHPAPAAWKPKQNVSMVSLKRPKLLPKANSPAPNVVAVANVRSASTHGRGN